MEDSVEQLLNGQYYKKYQERIYSEVTEKYHMTLLEIMVLLFLDTHEDNNTARDLVEVYHFTKSNVSKTIDNLLGRGFLQKQYDRQDRRYIHLIVRPEAAPVLELARKCRREISREIFRGISEDEIRVVRNVAQKIQENISRAMQPRA